MDEHLEKSDSRERRLHDVVGAYLEAADKGWAPDRERLLLRYPDLADELQAFFSAQSQVLALAHPERSHAGERERETIAPLTQVGGAGEPTPSSDYESLVLIKSGGMGSVFKAWQKHAKRWVALKTIKTGRLASAAEVRRFRAEAEAAAHLDHPNIVPIYEVGEHNGLPFFSMKYFEHGSLQQHLPRFLKDPRAAVRLLSIVARAVHYAHQHGILHRDLKPANILLDAQEQPYVADFGLAKRCVPLSGEPGTAEQSSPGSTDRVAGPLTALPSRTLEPPGDIEDLSYVAPEQVAVAPSGKPVGNIEHETVTGDFISQQQTRDGEIIGTHGYMAPELTGFSNQTSSTAADVYSLGAILYKLMTGKKPFPARNLDDAIRQVRECPPEPPCKLNPHADPRLEAICLKCLEKDPNRRYTSAEALAEDLDRWLSGEAPLAWPLPWYHRAWRAARLALLVGLLTGLCGFAAGALFFVYYYFDPERVPRSLEAETSRGKVTLIGMTGPPRWSRWNVGEGTVLPSPDVDKPFSITALEPARLELLRKPPMPRYRFSAEVRHERTLGAGMVGLYFAHVHVASGEETRRYWCDLTFADVGTLAMRKVPAKKGAVVRAKSGKVELNLERHALPRGFTSRATEVSRFFDSADGTKTAPGWRRLAVEVSPEKVQVIWEGQPLRELNQGELKKLEPGLVDGDKVVIPEFKFHPEGALGLYVRRGKASFRQVIIEPLD